MENAILRFLTHLDEKRGCANNTIEAYRADLLQFNHVVQVSEAGAVAPDGLNPDTLAAYVGWLQGQGYKPATVSRKIAAVRSFIKFLRDIEGIRYPHYSDELASPPSLRSEPRILSRGETEALLKAPIRFDNPRAIRDRAILAFILTTGFRAAEVILLRLEDVDLSRNEVYRPQSRDQPVPLGFAEEPMRVYVTKGRPHMMRNPREKAFFLNQRGKPFTRQGLWLVVKKWAEIAGLGSDVSPKTLRHTLTKNLLDQGKSRREVQQFLGLSSPNAIWIGRRNPRQESSE
ncbi:MAG: tyrosine-type recombinase/integrase [Anaerolineaceae bacterium]|nr:MAG: tyrosine-type recombinase/integrase [Anaerolineaceae bacterium]